jgi:hypothetical protein
MSGWRQAVFIRQRRCDVIQRALSTILDEESWSPATPRRLRVGSADASSRGWTMVIPELANFFLDRGGVSEPRLCRLARELRCPAYEVDVRDTVTLCEVDVHGRLRISGAALVLVELDGVERASPVVGFGALSLGDEIRDRVAELAHGPAPALADYLGAIAGFPAWTRLGDDAIAAGELLYEPPRIVTRAHSTDELRVLGAEIREAIARTTPRVALPTHDRRGRRPRSVSRPRR